MKLITDWRQSWRLWSVRLSAIGATIFAFLLAAPDQVQEIWNALPPEIQALVPNRTTLALFITAAVTIARVLRQNKPIAGGMGITQVSTAVTSNTAAAARFVSIERALDDMAVRIDRNDVNRAAERQALETLEDSIQALIGRVALVEQQSQPARLFVDPATGHVQGWRVPVTPATSSETTVGGQ